MKYDSSKLLIDELPLQVLPSLAVKIGLNEAIILQQLHYWLRNPNSGIKRDGYKWIYNTYEEWKETNFPFWSVPTIKRAVLNLEKMGFIVSEQFDSGEWNRKKYYRINYDVLNSNDRTDQIDPIDGIDLNRSLKTDNTADNTTNKIPAGAGAVLGYDPDEFSDVTTEPKPAEAVLLEQSRAKSEEYKERIRGAMQRAETRALSERVDLSGYPEHLRPVLKIFVDRWKIEPPARSKPSPDWIKSAGELIAATGEFGVDLLEKYADIYFAEYQKLGRPPFMVSRPGSLIGPLTAFAAQNRMPDAGRKSGRAPIEIGRK